MEPVANGGRKCQWENCSEPAVHRARWRRETGGLQDAVVYDYADYCDGHTLMASTHGAVRVETYEFSEKEAPSLVSNDSLT